MSLLEIRDVSYTYPGAQPVEALRDLQLTVQQNEFISVIGPSGCGKSTLLRLIADLLPVTSGEVRIAGEPAAAARKKRQIGFVFQDSALMPWRTSSKNVRLPLEVFKRASQVERKQAEDLLALVGLSIARALTYDPRLLLMDEPFGALDQITRDDMNQELLKVWEQKKSTVVFVTHSIAEAIYLSDRVVVLSPRPGRITDVISVPLDRPREPAIKRDPRFFATETLVLGALEGRAVHG